MFRVLLICSILATVVTAQSCSSEQQAAIKQCYLTYLKSYGFDVIPTWELYDHAEDNYRIRGWNGELFICKTGQALFSCIGSSDACVTVDIFKQISGLSHREAVFYIEDYRVMQYQCSGTGFTGKFKRF